jgi:hypothetical protein
MYFTDSKYTSKVITNIFLLNNIDIKLKMIVYILNIDYLLNFRSTFNYVTFKIKIKIQKIMVN